MKQNFGDFSRRIFCYKRIVQPCLHTLLRYFITQCVSTVEAQLHEYYDEAT